MKLLKPDPELSPYGLRAMKMVAQAQDGELGSSHRALLRAAQKLILCSNVDVDELEPISPDELASRFKQPELSRQLIRGMVVMSLVDGPATRGQTELISAFSKALEVGEPAVDVIRHLAQREMLLFRLDFYRRSHLRTAMESQYRTQGGILGVAKAVLGLKGLMENPPLAARFHALADLPENTLGYCLYRHFVDHGFAFPGEKAGFPIAGMFHDISHVLSGYPPTPEGEILTGGFQAGYRRNENAFFIVLFVVLTFSAGMNMTPLDQAQHIGLLGEGDLAERMLRAIERGSAMNTDLGDDWDFWPYLPRPLEEVRRELTVPPMN